eukprot:1142106-Pyramimonas_sp.AAC.1
MTAAGLHECSKFTAEQAATLESSFSRARGTEWRRFVKESVANVGGRAHGYTKLPVGWRPIHVRRGSEAPPGPEEELEGCLQDWEE